MPTPFPTSLRDSICLPSHNCLGLIRKVDPGSSGWLQCRRRTGWPALTLGCWAARSLGHSSSIKGGFADKGPSPLTPVVTWGFWTRALFSTAPSPGPNTRSWPEGTQKICQWMVILYWQLTTLTSRWAPCNQKAHCCWSRTLLKCTPTWSPAIKDMIFLVIPPSLVPLTKDFHHVSLCPLVSNIS